MAATDERQPDPVVPPPVHAREPAAEPLGCGQIFKPFIADLFYPGEDDRPFDVIDWPPGPVSAHLPVHAAVERLTPADFFDPLRDTTDAKRFATLHRQLAGHLSDLAVYRVSDGSAEVRIYVVGRTPRGGWAGVHTTSVET